MFIEAVEKDDNEGNNGVIWYYIQLLRNPVASNLHFKLLFKVVHLVLIIPHSNAGIEHILSLVNKNKREGSDRNFLNIEGSLSSILAVKHDRPESVSKCFECSPDIELLYNAKKATV